jgi:hypothetical protein
LPALRDSVRPESGQRSRMAKPTRQADDCQAAVDTGGSSVREGGASDCWRSVEAAHYAAEPGALHGSGEDGGCERTFRFPRIGEAVNSPEPDDWFSPAFVHGRDRRDVRGSWTEYDLELERWPALATAAFCAAASSAQQSRHDQQADRWNRPSERSAPHGSILALSPSS